MIGEKVFLGDKETDYFNIIKKWIGWCPDKIDIFTGEKTVFINNALIGHIDDENYLTIDIEITGKNRQLLKKLNEKTGGGFRLNPFRERGVLHVYSGIIRIAIIKHGYMEPA